MLPLLRKIAFPISLVYAAVVFMRNYLYDVGVLSSKSYGTPTICVGNLSVGGTGKTPMTEYVLRLLSNHRVAVLSRGYKRKSKGFYLAGPTSTVLELGDEPYQIHQKFPEVPIAVDADRRNGIEQLERLVRPDMIVLDDAFQHRKVKPTFSILLTTYQKPYRDDWYLPTGDLRDSKREAKRADVIIVTKCPDKLSEEDRMDMVAKLKPNTDQKVLFAAFAYKDVVSDGGQKKIPLSHLKNKKFALVTGIAEPGPLVQFLKSQGLGFNHFKFGDHHTFTEREIEGFKGSELIVTTEKDFVRLQGKVENLYYLEVAHSFSSEDQAYLANAVRALL